MCVRACVCVRVFLCVCVSVSLSTISLVLSLVSSKHSDHGPNMIYEPSSFLHSCSVGKGKGTSHNCGTKILGFILIGPNLVSWPSLSQSKWPGGQTYADCSVVELWRPKWCIQLPPRVHVSRVHGFCGRIDAISKRRVNRYLLCQKRKLYRMFFPNFLATGFPHQIFGVKIVRHLESCKNSETNTNNC